MKKFLIEIGIASIISLIPTFLIWIPFYLKMTEFWNIPLKTNGLATIIANYDGPLYIVVAKSLYNPAIIKSFEFPLTVEYYAAHFPLFPLLIRLFSLGMSSTYAMLVVTLISSIFAVYFFRKLIGQYLNTKNTLIATIMFAFFPARWLIVRSVGSPEPLFVASLIASVYYFKNNKYWLAGLWGALAAMTKSPGILLFVSYFLSLLIPRLAHLRLNNISSWIRSLNWKAYPILLIPLSLLGVFTLYSFTLNDFFAYFHSGDNIHLFFPPFQIFNYSAPWVGTFWLEEILFVYLLGAIALANLIRMKEKTIAWFVGVFFTTILFVSHRDIIRYALPILPFTFIAFKDSFARKEFIYIIALLAIPAYLFALAFISQNVMPISNWSLFL